MSEPYFLLMPRTISGLQSKIWVWSNGRGHKCECHDFFYIRPCLHCSGTEVVPDSLAVYTVLVAFVNQVEVLLLCIVKEQKCILHVMTI